MWNKMEYSVELEKKSQLCFQGERDCYLVFNPYQIYSSLVFRD